MVEQYWRTLVPRSCFESGVERREKTGGELVVDGGDFDGEGRLYVGLLLERVRANEHEGPATEWRGNDTKKGRRDERDCVFQGRGVSKNMTEKFGTEIRDSYRGGFQ